MIKQLILIIQVFGLFFYQLLFTGDLTVTQKLPATLTQGEEAIVEITINKGDLPGFAKVQQLFPEGFTAEPVETKGATFSFKDNKVKFIWMSLPADQEFTISYKVVPKETVVGDFTLGGKFSFISESERKNIDIPVSNFSVIAKTVLAEVEPEITKDVVAEEVVDEETVEEDAEEIAETVEPVLEKPIIEEVSETVEEEPSVIKIATVTCKRTIENIEGGKYKVTVEINKEGVEGFAKVTEKIPAGFVASENDSKNGVFSFKDNTMKILWMAVPEGETYTITYNLESNSGTENGSYDIIGFYSYLENDVTSKYVIEGSSFQLNVEELVAEEPVIVTPPKEVEVEKEPEVTEPVIAKVVEKEKEVVTATPNPENGVNYKVQVGAGHAKVPSTYFATRFSLKDNVSTINHEGWIKYLVGSFNEYKSARDKRNVVRNNVKTAFVTAYNSGTRITVQEALMISNQKWYK